jgi:hypothetical protein
MIYVVKPVRPAGRFPRSSCIRQRRPTSLVHMQTVSIIHQLHYSHLPDRIHATSHPKPNPQIRRPTSSTTATAYPQHNPQIIPTESLPQPEFQPSQSADNTDSISSPTRSPAFPIRRSLSGLPLSYSIASLVHFTRDLSRQVPSYARRARPRLRTAVGRFER